MPRPSMGVNMVAPVAVEDNGPGIPIDDRKPVFVSDRPTDESSTAFGQATVAKFAGAHDRPGEATGDRIGAARIEVTGTVAVSAAGERQGRASRAGSRYRCGRP